MKKQEKYTQLEVDSNINKLISNLNNAITQRKSINKVIKDTNDQIKYWKELDQSQIKLF